MNFTFDDTGQLKPIMESFFIETDYESEVVDFPRDDIYDCLQETGIDAMMMGKEVNGGYIRKGALMHVKRESPRSRSGYQKWYVQNSKKVRKAHRLLQYHVNRGYIEKPKICSQCGKDGEIHGHHEDYDEPLEVIWLCAGCHLELHADLAIWKG
jgi:hypothetical protein